MNLDNFTFNYVLLKHNTDILTYTFDLIGNPKFQVYLDMYRLSVLYAEEKKDTITCDKIAYEIANAICETSVLKRCFLEFGEKDHIWYDMGTGAIPC